MGMKREIVDLEQNTAEWYEWRSTVHTASQAPVIMQAAPTWWEVRSWDDLRVPRDERTVPDEFTQALWAKGHRLEREWREAHIIGIKPACLQRGDMSASLDGWDENPDGWAPVWWEIKTVRNQRSRMWTVDLDPDPMTRLRQEHPHVYWQLVHQAHVVGNPSALCHLVVVVNVEVFRVWTLTAGMLMRDWPALAEQWAQYVDGGQPGLSDSAWVKAAAEWQQAKAAADAAKARLSEARKQVLMLDAEQSASKVRGGGISVTTSSRQGGIDWKLLAKDQGLDEEAIERYRKPDFPVTTIRRTS